MSWVGEKLSKLGNLESSESEIMEECTTFMAAAYGIDDVKDMTESRILL